MPRVGRDLAESYYEQVVAPLLTQRWPGLPHAAGRLGTGSDVLGLDDTISTDHDWGPRLTVLVPADRCESVRGLLADRLPERFEGYPTRFAFTGSPDPVLAVEVDTASAFAVARLGLDPRTPLSARDWLSLSGQAVLEVVAGPLFHDSAGEITDIRGRLEWYPDDLWYYVVASYWVGLAEELPLMSRAGERGDDLGSRVIAARLVGIAMHLGFLINRRWAPYPKWLGTMFADLPGIERVRVALAETLQAVSWRERQAGLAAALDELLRLQVERGLPGGPAATIPFYDRPYLHPDPGIVDELLSDIADPDVRTLPRGRGSVEQQTGNVALLVDPSARRRLVDRE